MCLPRKELPSLHRLLEVFRYEEESGLLYWKSMPHPAAHNIKVGSVAGTKSNSNGYICVTLDKQLYVAHRIIWKMFYGTLGVDEEIDHADRNRHNNKIDNLSIVTRSENCCNRKFVSAHPGVCWYKRTKKWHARYKKKHIGYFEKLSDAIYALDAVKNVT